MNPLIIAYSLLVLLLPQPQSNTGTIRGTVTSESSGERIVHARIVLESPPYVTYTDSNGVYRLSRVAAGVYSLTISAQGYARLTFRGLIVPQYTPLVIDATLRDAKSSSDSVITVKFSTRSDERPLTEDKMKFYQPDSTIDYKIRIYNPERDRPRTRVFVVPDSVLKHK